MVKINLSSYILILTMSLSLSSSTPIFHNITTILNKFPNYSIQNNYISSTKISQEINSRKTLTCLVLPNPAMSALAANHTQSSLDKALRLLVLLDYFDPPKLHDIDGGTTITTTLYQTTGDAIEEQGFVNVTDLRGGRVAFRSAVPGSDLDSYYTKSVLQIPYSISILEVSAPIVFPGLFDDVASDVNLTAMMEAAGCGVFASVVSSSGMVKIFRAEMGKGITILAPNDEAFRAKDVPDLNSLSSADLVTLIQYHAVDSYYTKDSIRMVHNPIGTMASGAAGNYEIRVSVEGDDVVVHTGVDSSRIVGVVFDEIPVCVLKMERVLLPEELFGKAPSLSPAPGADVVSAPRAAPAIAPAPAIVPAPAIAPASEDSPAMSPADEVSDDGDDRSAAVGAKVSFFCSVMVMAVVVFW